MDNQLEHIDEIKKLIAEYHVSEQAKKLVEVSNLVLLVSVTSAGRNTIINELVKGGKYHYVISDTTRKPRSNNGIEEQNGVNYWFKTETEFIEGLKQNQYLEAAIIHEQQVSGINIEELQKADHDGKIAITDIETQGANIILQIKKDTPAIFILPPSFKEWMKRLEYRGPMSQLEKRRRLDSAKDELAEALSANKYCYLINDDLASVVSAVNKIINSHMVDVDLQRKGRQLAQQLYDQLP